MVGFLCENVFSYVKVMPPAPLSTQSQALQLGNARAIALSMLCMTVGPWLLTVVAYGFLHLTYKVDSRHGSDFAGVQLGAAVCICLPFCVFHKVLRFSQSRIAREDALAHSAPLSPWGCRNSSTVSAPVCSKR